jgi:hypothetical protein
MKMSLETGEKVIKIINVEKRMLFYSICSMVPYGVYKFL